MPEQNPNPAAPPAADAGQAPGDQQGADKNAAAPDNNNQNPAGANPDQAGQNQDEEKTEISVKELNDLKRDSGRWKTRLKGDRKTRRENRRQPANPDQDDNTDPETLEALRDRDVKIDELSSENFRYKIENKVRNIFDNEEYKDISSSVKRAIVKNPLGFTNPESKTIEDAVADIEDYLDDELDAMSKTENTQQLNPADKVGEHMANARPGVQNVDNKDNTPPAGGSGPSSPEANINEGVEGKVGPDRSTAVLNNLLKGRK
jgi:hypothetical protein